MSYRDIYPRLAELSRRHTTPQPPTPDLTGYEYSLLSQNGEDGVLAEILQRLGGTPAEFVEFGIATGAEGNCIALADAFGWSGLFIEGDPTYAGHLEAKYAGVPRVRTLNAHITPDNINALFAGNGVSEEPGIVSIDVDGNDLWLWRALTHARPQILVIEYNASLPPDTPLVQPYDPDWRWDGTDWFGASLAALEQVGAEKGYRLVHTELAGVNAFFVREDLADPFGTITPPRRAANYFGTGTGHPPHPSGGHYVTP